MEQKVNLELSIQQINVVLAGIAKLPIEAGLDTFTAVQAQAQAQLGPPTQTTPPDGPLSGKVVN